MFGDKWTIKIGDKTIHVDAITSASLRMDSIRFIKRMLRGVVIGLSLMLAMIVVGVFGIIQLLHGNWTALTIDVVAAFLLYESGKVFNLYTTKVSQEFANTQDQILHLVDEQENPEKVKAPLIPNMFKIPVKDNKMHLNDLRFGLYEQQQHVFSLARIAGWFNAYGERIGTGDLDARDMHRIQVGLYDNEVFIVVPYGVVDADIAYTQDVVLANAAYIIDKTGIFCFEDNPKKKPYKKVNGVIIRYGSRTGLSEQIKKNWPENKKAITDCSSEGEQNVTY